VSQYLLFSWGDSIRQRTPNASVEFASAPSTISKSFKMWDKFLEISNPRLKFLQIHSIFGSPARIANRVSIAPLHSTLGARLFHHQSYIAETIQPNAKAGTHMSYFVNFVTVNIVLNLRCADVLIQFQLTG
jgi:hypothetical protein